MEYQTSADEQERRRARMKALAQSMMARPQQQAPPIQQAPEEEKKIVPRAQSVEVEKRETRPATIRAVSTKPKIPKKQKEKIARRIEKEQNKPYKNRDFKKIEQLADLIGDKTTKREARIHQAQRAQNQQMRRRVKRQRANAQLFQPVEPRLVDYAPKVVKKRIYRGMEFTTYDIPMKFNLYAYWLTAKELILKSGFGSNLLVQYVDPQTGRTVDLSTIPYNQIVGSYEQFEDYMEQKRYGFETDNGWSDMAPENSKLNYNFFSIIKSAIPMGNAGSFTSKFFKFYKQENKKPCFYEAMASLGIQEFVDDFQDQIPMFKDLDLIRAQQICNQYGVILKTDDFPERIGVTKEIKQKVTKVKKTGLEKTANYNKINILKQKDKIIIFNKDHYQAVQDQCELYLDASMNIVCEKFKVLLKAKDAKTIIKKGMTGVVMGDNVKKQEECIDQVDEYKELVITYDLETVFDPNCSNLIRAINISFIFENKLIYFAGDHCIQEFFSYILERDSCYKYILNAFNGSRFDAYLLMEELVVLGNINKLSFNKSQLMQMVFCDRHEIFDVCKYALSSLANAGRDFKLDYVKSDLGALSFEQIWEFYIQNDCNQQKMFRKFHLPQCEKEIYRFEMTIDFNDYKKTKEQLDAIKIDKCQCKNMVDFIKYGFLDVLSTHQLYQKIETIALEINEEFDICCPPKKVKNNKKQKDPVEEQIQQDIDDIIEDKKYLRLYEFKTIGTYIYTIFEKTLIKKGIRLPKVDLEQYNNIKNFQTAGRVQTFKGRYFHFDEEVAPKLYQLCKYNPTKARYVMLDVKSEYPFVMLNRWFPLGQIENISFDLCMLQEKIGFYWVTFEQSALTHNILPNKQKLDKNGKVTKQLDWEYKGVIKQFINTVDIQELISNGANIIEIGEGIAFTQKIFGSDLFSCLVHFADKKSEQDVFKTNADWANYNPSMRQMMKIFLNSLSGKVGQNLILQSMILIQSHTEYCKQLMKNDKMSLVKVLNEKSALFKVEQTQEEKIKRYSKPVYYSALIYSYARKHLYENLIRDYDILYCDTDSGLLDEKNYHKFMLEKGWLMGEDFGDFSYEDGTIKIHNKGTDQEEHELLIRGIALIAPKNYFLFGKSLDDLIKKGFKGINMKKSGDRIISKEQLEEADFLFNEQNEVKIPKIYKSINEAEYLKMMFSLWQQYAPNTMDKCDNISQFLSQLMQKIPTYILTSSIARQTQSTGMKVVDGKIEFQKDASKLYQRFLIKKIE